MSENIAHRQIVYRLLPGTQPVARTLAGQAEACRYTWNEVLARTSAEYEDAKANGTKPPSVTRNSLCKRFTELRRDVSWLPGYSSHITRYTLKYQADAWSAAFRGDKSFPRFKSKDGTPSFTIPEKVKIRDGKLHIPKIGWLTMCRKGGNPYPDGKPVRAVVRKVAGKWYATICYAVKAPEIADNGVTAGVDMNVRQVAVVTTEDEEEIIHAPDTRPNGGSRRRRSCPRQQKLALDTKIKRAQRQLARQQEGSRRSAKTKSRLQRLERKRADVRRNWHHQTSRRIADQASTVVVEDLNTEGMTRSAKGTAECPGKNVRAKAGLNRGIQATGWRGLKQMLQYKAREVIEVDPAYTSQRCHACGKVDAASRNDRDYTCVACGHADHADLNAARNILASGIGAAARRGASTLVTPPTREIDATDA